MLDIRIDGQPTDLKPSTKLILERFNPMLEFSTVQGSRVYDFELEDTPTNRRLMGYADNPQQPTFRRRFFCEKYIDGNLIEQGYARIREVNNGYKLFFTQDLGNIFGDYQDRLLSQLTELGTVPLAIPVAGADFLTAAYCWPTILNPSYYGNAAVSGFAGRINDYSLTTQSYAEHGRVPMLFVKWVLNRFGQLTGWRFKGSFWNSPLFSRLLFYNLYSTDGQTNLIYSNHLPDVTAGGLLIEMRKLFNLWLDFDVRNRVCTIDLVDEVLALPAILNWTERANPANLRITDQNGRIELGYDLSGNDATVKPTPAAMDVYQTATTAANQDGVLLSIKSRFSTLLTDPATGLAMTDQVGYSPLNKDSKPGNDAPRFLLWNGIVAGRPTATNADSGQSLLWHGPGNLADTYWHRFETFRTNTFLLRKRLALTPADLATFNYRHKVHIQGVNYIVGDIKASLERRQKAVICEADLWRI